MEQTFCSVFTVQQEVVKSTGSPNFTGPEFLPFHAPVAYLSSGITGSFWPAIWVRSSEDRIKGDNQLVIADFKIPPGAKSGGIARRPVSANMTMSCFDRSRHEFRAPDLPSSRHTLFANVPRLLYTGLSLLFTGTSHAGHSTS